MCYFVDTESVTDLSLSVEIQESTTTEESLATSDNGGIFCYCVTTARQLGVDIPIGTNADEFKPNTTPHIGSLALFQYDDVSHVAVVSEINKDNFKVRQGNKERCEYSEEWVAWDNPHLKGFWAPERRSTDELMDDIAFCESGGKQHNEDGSIVMSHTNDVGKYQINLVYHAKRARELGMDLYTEKGNTEYAYLLYEEQGPKPWSASQHCWNGV